jgi:fructose-1,6-bisphosphatase/inositol monophosphatase family enzyme
MNRSAPDPMFVYRQRLSAIKARAPVAVGVAAAFFPMILLSALAPPTLVMPLYSAAAIAIAAMIAIGAHASNVSMDADHLTAWDIAGGIALIGIAAGIFSEPAHLIGLFEGGGAKR